MATLALPDGAALHYQVDDFTAPGRVPETVLLIHGNFESGLAWYGWPPTLARHLRVVRPDMRGFGRSAPMPADFRWSLDLVIDDFCALMDALDAPRFHVLGAKIGGTIARAFAARRPGRVVSLTVVGSPPPRRGGAEELTRRLADRRAGGAPAMQAWIRASMQGRLGTDFPEVGAKWWTEYMGRTSVESEIGFFTAINTADVTDDIPGIACPTLVITTEGSGLASVAETQAWQQQIPNSQLAVIPGDSYHAAVTDATSAPPLPWRSSSSYLAPAPVDTPSPAT